MLTVACWRAERLARLRVISMESWIECGVDLSSVGCCRRERKEKRDKKKPHLGRPFRPELPGTGEQNGKAHPRPGGREPESQGWAETGFVIFPG